jgi:hypothetical protein
VLAAATSACVGSGCASPESPTVTIQTFPEEPPYGSHPTTSALVAFQDGDGPWQKLQGANGTYSTPVTGQRYAVAVICQVIFGSVSSARVDLSYLSVSDTTHVKASGCIDTRPTVHVSAQLQGVPSDQQGEVYFGGSLASQSTTDGSFEASLVRGEPVDVLISALAGNVPRKVYRGPALDGLADQTLQYDLGVLGAALDSQPLTVTGLDPTDSVEVRSLLSTRPSQAAWFVDDRPYSTTPPDHYSSVPVAAGRQPDDITILHLLVLSTPASGDGRSYVRAVTMEMKTPAPTTVALPAPWSTESPTLENTALRRAMLTLPAASPAQGAVDYYVQFVTPGGSEGHTWNLTIGAGWLEGRGAVTVTTPDLSGLVDGPPALALPLDRDVLWFLSRVERNVDFGAVATDGMRLLGNQIIGGIHSPAPSP